MEPVRVLLAGYGRFGSRHAEVIQQHPTAELVGVCDPGAGVGERVRKELPGVAHGDDLVTMLDELRPQALLVVSPEPTHAEMTRAAFERGVHVLAEKPLAIDLDEARALVKQATESGLVYQAGYLLRYEPRHALLAERVLAGEFGDLASIRAKRSCSRVWFEAYGQRVHPVYETLVHDIDVVLWLSGQRCTGVHAWERSHLGAQAPDTLVAVLELSGGALATLESVWLVPSGAPVTVDGWGEGGSGGSGTIDASLEVVGTLASGSVTTYEPSLTIMSETTTAMPDTTMWPRIGGRVVGALRDEVWDFLARVRGDVQDSVASIEDALHVQEIADAIVLSAAEGRQIAL